MDKKTYKLLLIDDEEDILIDTKDILEKKGFLVLTAADSDKALEIFQREKPQICLIDIHMPKSKLDGIAILEEMRKTNAASYCIMLTRITDKNKLEQAKKLQANRYVLKPLDYTELLTLVGEAVKAIS